MSTRCVAQEVNSVEAMKGAVQIGLGAAFVSAAVVEKEVALGTLAVLRVQGVPLVRHLQCVLDPARCARSCAQQLHSISGGETCICRS